MSKKLNMVMLAGAWMLQLALFVAILQPKPF